MKPDRDELLGSDGQHAAFIERIHRNYQRLFGLGGGGVLALCVLAPLLISHLASLSALQVGLVVIGCLLVGLTALRYTARLYADRLRRRTDRYCARHSIHREELLAAARRLGDRWFFFTALWDQASPQRESRTSAEDPQPRRTDAQRPPGDGA